MMKMETVLASKGAHVVTILPDQSLREAAELLTKYNIGALVVVNSTGAPIGILSERDIVRAAARNDQVLGLSVDAAMSKDLVTAAPSDDLRSVLRTMSERNFRHMPIVDEGMLVGIVSIRDLVNVELGEYQGEVETLETQITGG